MKKLITIILAFLVSIGGVSSQTPGNDKLILPSIMILPGKKAFKNISSNEIPFNIKAGMATVNDAFKNFGFDTKDFEAAYNKLIRDGKLDDCDQCDLTEMLFDDAAADVLVELESEFVQTPNGNKVTVIVEAYHFSSATSWGSEVCESNYFRGAPVTDLTKSAINMYAYQDEEGEDLSYIDHFMFEIVDYLERCKEYGAIADMRFTIDADAECDMDCQLPQADNTRLKYVIEDWLEETAKDGYYKIKSTSKNQLIVEEYRYDCDSRPSRIERKLTRFFDELGLEFEVKTGRSTLYVTIL